MSVQTINVRDTGRYTIATLVDALGQLRNVTINPREANRYGAAQAVHLALDERERIARAELQRVQAIRDALPNRLTETTP